jgi:hypothetical protein
MRQSVAGKDVKMEVEESAALGALTRQQPVKTNREDLLRAVMNCRMLEFAIAVQLNVVKICRRAVYPVIYTNPVSTHRTRENIVYFHRQIFLLKL